MDYPKSELFEKLADIEHQRWASWQKYLHSKCTKDEVGGLVIPAWQVKKAERQIKTDYKDLSEEEKDSDRREVMSYWGLIHTKKQIIEALKKTFKTVHGENLTTEIGEEDTIIKHFFKNIHSR